jgi:hypothetical protein
MAEKLTVAVLSERVRIAIIVAVSFGAGVVAVAIYFNHVLSTDGERLATLDTKVDGISRNLERVLDRRSKNLLTVPKEAVANPGEVKDSVQWAKTRKLQIPKEDLTSVGADLLQTAITLPQTPDIWGAVSDVVNFRTEVEHGEDPAVAEKKLRSCSSIPPTVRANGSRDANGRMNYAGNTSWENCYVKIDDPALPPIMRTVLECTNCVVEYAGGKIDIRQAIFHECLFLLHVQAAPTAKGLQLVQDVVKGLQPISLG